MPKSKLPMKLFNLRQPSSHFGTRPQERTGTPAFNIPIAIASTLGEFNAKLRKQLDMTHKEVASRIIQECDKEALPTQYLNDMEHTARCVPTCVPTLRYCASSEFCRVELDMLYFRGGSAS